MRDHRVIDPKAIENLRALDSSSGDGFLREVLGIFLDDTPQRIAELEQSLQTGDVSRFTRAAHSVKGSSANVGALALRTSAEALESRVRQHGLSGVDELLADLRAQFARTRAELARILDGR